SRNRARPRAIAGTRARKSTAVIRFFLVTACIKIKPRRHGDTEIRQNNERDFCLTRWRSLCLCGSVAYSLGYSHVLNIQLQPNVALVTVRFKVVRQIDALIHPWCCFDLFDSAPPNCFEGSIVVPGNAHLEMLLLQDLRFVHNPPATRNKD